MLFDENVWDVGIKVLEGGNMSSFSEVTVADGNSVSLLINRNKFLDDDYHVGLGYVRS